MRPPNLAPFDVEPAVLDDPRVPAVPAIPRKPGVEAPIHTSDTDYCCITVECSQSGNHPCGFLFRYIPTRFVERDGAPDNGADNCQYDYQMPSFQDAHLLVSSLFLLCRMARFYIMLPDKSIVIKQAPKEWGLICANTFRRLDVELRNVHFCLIGSLDLGENSLAFGVL